MKVVSNAGPLIHLSWIDQLDLLRELFEEVLVPVAVHEEVLHAEPEVPGVAALHAAFTAGWLQVLDVQNRAAVRALRGHLEHGEAEAIVLMEESGADLLLLDDLKARVAAENRNLALTGTIGILSRARGQRLVPTVVPLLQILKQRGFRVSAELLTRIRQEEENL